jgi:asparagine N-glycosylation enzyme membrane subunit Stt3
MYATAAVYRIIQMLNPSFELLDILPTSRWLSIMMTVLAIWGTYLLGAKLFNASVGLFASALFTFSPYVLHFGHVTLTQGDTFTAAPVIFSLITFVEFTKKRTTFWLFAFSSCLALAIATKFFLLIFISA